MDGSYRHIDVQVTAKGKYKTAYRRGYNADDTSKAVAPQDTDPLRPLLIRGLPSATQLLYGVRVVPANPQPAANATRAGKNPKLTGPTTRYSIDFFVRWQDVKLAETPKGTHSGSIQIGLLAYDRDGKAVNWAEATQGMNLEPGVYASIQKSGIPAHAEIDLPDTDIFLETGIYDWGSGKAGTLEIPLRVGADAAVASRQWDNAQPSLFSGAVATFSNQLLNSVHQNGACPTLRLVEIILSVGRPTKIPGMLSSSLDHSEPPTWLARGHRDRSRLPPQSAQYRSGRARHGQLRL
jgi:hypothetical protein